MSSKGKVPDAWDDDDWIKKADVSSSSQSDIYLKSDPKEKTEETVKEPEAKPKKLTKAERRAQQAEFNRQLWQEAYG